MHWGKQRYWFGLLVILAFLVLFLMLYTLHNLLAPTFKSSQPLLGEVVGMTPGLTEAWSLNL